MKEHTLTLTHDHTEIIVHTPDIDNPYIPESLHGYIILDVNSDDDNQSAHLYFTSAEAWKLADALAAHAGPRPLKVWKFGDKVNVGDERCVVVSANVNDRVMVAYESGDTRWIAREYVSEWEGE